MNVAAVLRTLGVVCSIAASGAALAQPAKNVPDPKATAKLNATELRDLGNKLFDEKNYNGALAVFKEAHARFPSVKILLNIGVTLNKLERFADAANAFQRYVDAPDADASVKPEIEKAIKEIDAKVAVVELSISPSDADVQINDDEWFTAKTFAMYRVPDGKVTVHVKKDGFQPGSKELTIAAGAKATAAITIVPIPEKTKEVIKFVPTASEGPRSRFGGFAMEHLDIPHSGAATLVGVTFDIIDRLQVQGAAILGPNNGAYLSATFAILPGRFRPIIVAGMPVFFSDGARYGVRGAGGLEVQINRHLSLIAEVGVEYLLNPEMDIKETVFIPAVGVSGRL